MLARSCAVDMFPIGSSTVWCSSLPPGHGAGESVILAPRVDGDVFEDCMASRGYVKAAD